MWKKYKGKSERVFGKSTGIMREIVEKLLKIEAELGRRRNGDELARYNTGEIKHEKQLAFHKSVLAYLYIYLVVP